MYKTLVRLRSRMLVFLTHRMALPLLRRLRKPEYFPFTPEELLHFPVGSLGHDLVHFLHHRDLRLLPYYAKHDIKHILLQYETTDEGEVCLQCFMLGNGHVSFPVLATVTYGLITMPEFWPSFTKAFRRGRTCMPIQRWPWHQVVWEPTIELRKKINNPKIK
ncbi:MAG: hypothetical protein IPI66_00430 [Chitinophagaceae bacterium]|nr:hypothetical protein [Chitinophagaceae bacterium]MBL0054682.1 hypothetical protein [Chitinophagaceae bacterium]